MIQENLVQFDWTSLKVLVILMLAAVAISLAVGMYALYKLLIKRDSNAGHENISDEKDK